MNGAPSRRALLCGSAAILADGPAVAATNPDAGLLALAAEFHRLDAVLQRWNDAQIGDEEGEAANTEWWRALRGIRTTPARTPAGIKAKASALVVAIVGMIGEECQEGEHKLAVSLAADIAAAPCS